MKTARNGKKDDGLVFTHKGQACTVRRSHGRHYGSHVHSLKNHGTILERLFLPLLPRLTLGEIV